MTDSIRVGYENPNRGEACGACGHAWWDRVPGEPWERCRYCDQHGRYNIRWAKNPGPITGRHLDIVILDDLIEEGVDS